ncbi:hypothetical protein GQ457_09G011270 [Hibiscus cannabinus]
MWERIFYQSSASVYSGLCYAVFSPAKSHKSETGSPNNFWWSNNQTLKGIHWCSWSKMCLPKNSGGMCFRDLSKFNIVLLAKQGWRLLYHPSSLLTRVLEARYFPRMDFMTANLGDEGGELEMALISAYGTMLGFRDRSNLSDELIWRYDNTGIYSPKSGYKLLTDDEVVHHFSPFGPRKLQLRNVCLLCNEAKDSTEHFVLYCVWTRQVLDHLGFSYPFSLQELNYQQDISQLFTQLDDGQKAQLILTFGAICHGAELGALIPSSNPQLISHPTKWSPPADNIIKLNLDAHFISTNCKPFSSVISRNSLCQPLVTCAYSHDLIAEPFIAKAKACEVVMSIAFEMGFHQIQVEGDSLTVIKKLQSRIADKSILHSIISYINNKKCCFDAITFSYVGRRGNEVVHALARIGLHFGNPQYWFGEVPATVEEVVRQDLAP